MALMDKEQIMEIIPHRAPFLLIDTIEELEPGIRVVATKYMDPDSFWFKGHFPGTGDIFTALLTGQLLRGKSLPQAVGKAVELLERLIFLEQDVAVRNNGIRIEKYLSVLTE